MGILVKVKDMPNGAILWKGNTILGIKGDTLEEHGEKYSIELYI